MSKRTRKARLIKFLKSLGRTGDEVADSLRKMGIKGHVQEGDCCPLAELLKKKFRGSIPEVTRSEITMDDEKSGITVNAEVSLTAIPPSIVAFIEKFDNNFYPDLVA